MEILQSSVGLKINKEDICLANSATMHIMLKDKKYFSYLIMKEANVNTIFDSTKLKALEKLIYYYLEEENWP